MKKIEIFFKEKNKNGRLDIYFIFYKAIKVALQSRLKLFAASLSYATLLAVVPLLAVLFSLLRSFGIDSVIQNAISTFLAPLGESGAEVSKYLFEFVQNAQTGLLGGVGLVFLFYSIFTLIQKVELALNQIWYVSKSRSIWVKLVGYFSSLMLVVILSVAIVWINLFLKQIEGKILLTNISFLGVLVHFLIKFISFLIVVSLLAILYLTIPNTKVQFKSAFIGGLFCTLCWIPLTKIFSLMIGGSTNYSIIYSSFASVVILLIWLNIVWLLFLSGALVSYFVQYPNLLKVSSRKYLNPAEKVYYSQQIIHVFLDYFLKSKGRVSLKTLLIKTKLPHQQMLLLLEPLEEKNILVKTNDKESFYLLATDPANLSDDYIYKIVYGEVRSKSN